MILDRHEITEDSIRQVLTESVEADNPDSEQADAADLIAKAEAAVPLYIVPLYNLDDPVHDFRHAFFTFRPIVSVLQKTHPAAAATTAVAAAVNADEDGE